MDFSITDAHREKVRERERSTDGYPFVIAEGDYLTLHHQQDCIESVMQLSQPNRLLFHYTKAMLAFAAFQPAPEHILMLGLGGGSLVKHCYHHFPASRITVIEMDAYTIAEREQFMVPPDDERLQVIHGDGIRYLADQALQVDVLIVDCIFPGMLPFDQEQRFYRSCWRALSHHGVMVTNMLSKQAVDTMVSMMNLYASFDCRQRWCSFTQRNNIIALAVKDDRSWIAKPGVLARLLRVFQESGMAPDFFCTNGNQISPLHALNRQWLRHMQKNPTIQPSDADDKVSIFLEPAHPPARRRQLLETIAQPG